MMQFITLVYVAHFGNLESFLAGLLLALAMNPGINISEII